jgi:hypothetical protein
MADQPALGNVHYPKAGYLYLLNRLQKADEDIMCLINICVAKDQKIAELEAKLIVPPDEAVSNQAQNKYASSYQNNVSNLKP